MVYTILKPLIIGYRHKVVSIRCYRNFSEPRFQEELADKMYENPPGNYDEFEYLYVITLNSFAPEKPVSVRGNNSAHYV